MQTLTIGGKAVQHLLISNPAELGRGCVKT
jgi:hypothetical protein